MQARGFALQYVNPQHPYLASRGVTSDTVQAFGVGLYTMGSTLSQRQADLLASHFDQAVLMLDGDKAGRDGAGLIAPMLAQRLRVATISLKEGTQPDQLTLGEIQRLVRDHGAVVGERDTAQAPGGRTCR
jgi:hypothetical protein